MSQRIWKDSKKR